MKMLTKIMLFLVIIINQFANLSYAETVELKFGIYASERRAWLDSDNTPILKHLKEQLKSEFNVDVKIKTVFFPDYNDAVKAIVKKEVDFARLGAASYLDAKKQSPKLSIIGLESNKGSTYHEGVIGVLKESPIVNVKDLKGKKMAFGNKSSTIGRYCSQKYLTDNGITEAELKQYQYLGRHDNVAIAIIRKTHDAGAFKSSILKDKNLKERIRVIARFKAPTQAWVARAGIDMGVLTKLRQVLISVPKESITIKSRDAFVKGDDSNFKYLRESIQNNDLFFTKKLVQM